MIARKAIARTLLAALAAGSLLLAANAVGEVIVYLNDFSSQGDFRQIVRSGGGKRCDKKYREKSKVMLASVKRSPTTCSFRAPVQGDDELANQSVAVDGKFLKTTPKAVRGQLVHRGHRPRRRHGSGYSLRIFPQRKRFELDRGPGRRRLPGRPARATRSTRSTSATGSR